MPEEYDPWKLSSGLRDDMVFSITDAYFAPDADYQGGRVILLHLIGTDETGEPVTIKMSPGADWDSSDGGNTITHPTKKQQNINGSSIYGHWISYSQEIPELVTELRQRGTPTNAKVWEGLILHLQEREIKFGRNIDPQQRLMPTEYFGVIEDTLHPVVQAPAPPVAMAPAGVPLVVTDAVPDPQALIAAARAKAAAQNGNHSPLYNELVELAKVSDWPTFLGKVLEDPRVLADDELIQQAADQSLLYSSARS